MDFEIIKEEVEKRVNLYALISRIMLIEVDKEFLETIESDENIMELFPNYRDWSKREEFDMDTIIREYLNVDFASMFLMNMVPYESFYTRDDQMIESGGDNPVIELYNSLDFRVDIAKARIVSADHIGVELEFMYMLCIALLKACNAKDEDGVKELFAVQKGFMRDHMLQWMPMFLINMRKESITPLYHDASELSMEFLLSDYEYINETIAKIS
ncbi:Putative oxidoreductase component of anaerobic dehydrogenases; Chaperone protein TorD [hydrothermal vent metagenome]|uniref:Putative oxidoreductase component of anaerobic dehydrogenases Chaperone protein TorD n=1 Tax=hydrothermal vent metagenome TaxID=652676 RepID=A0A1W1EJI8_9ZZZZ